jgi:hypothetical protein
MRLRRKHWKAEAAELVRSADPGASGPIYLLSVQQAAAVYEPDRNIFGFTGLLLCYRLRRAIGRKWQGPGFCAVIDIESGAPRVQWLGAVLHEYAHHVIGRWESHLATIAEFRLEREVLPRRRPGQVLRKRRVESGKYDAMHGPRFYRLAAHLAHRTWRLFSGGFTDITGPFRESQLWEPLAYRAALGGEPARRAAEPLNAIDASDPPAAFAELVREDAARVKTISREISAAKRATSAAKRASHRTARCAGSPLHGFPEP